MAKVASMLSAVLVFALFLGVSRGVGYDGLADDELLDQWLQEQMADMQSRENPFRDEFPDFMNDADLGFAAPGHAEESDYMRAFFENQDHQAFADVARGAGYRDDDEMDKHLADFFGFTGESESEAQVDPTAQKYNPVTGKVPIFNLEHPQPDMEHYISKYFDDVSQGDVQTLPMTGYDIPGAAADTREFFPGTEEGEVDGYQAEEAGRDGVEGSDFDFFGTQRQSSPDQTTYQSLEENDLELWYQAMSQGNEEDVEEEEEDTSKLLNLNFMDEFPDELFSEVTIQEVTQADEECGVWIKKMRENHEKIKELGMALQERMKDLKVAMDAYKAQEKVSCDKDCAMICLSKIVGTECSVKINGTCFTEVPVTDDCGSKLRDPECEAEEAACRAKMKPVAEKMKEAVKKKDEAKEAMDAEVKRQELEVEKVPEKCVKQPANKSPSPSPSPSGVQ